LTNIYGIKITMCKCVDVEIQSYDNQTVVIYPHWFISEKKVRAAGIDNCILEEILQLWEAGVQTTESCCGHNKAQGYISVVDSSIPKMKKLGYEAYQSNFRNESGWDGNGYRPDSFKPKSV
jgi:hypothetical protein